MDTPADLIIKTHPDTLLLMTTDPAKQERMRSIVSTLLYIEGAIVLALGVWMAVMGVTHENREILPLMGVLLFCIVGGLGLLACGRAFAEKKNWGRGPAVLANLIALGVARIQFQGDFLIGAVPLLILALTVLYLAIAIVPQGKEK